MKQSDLLEGNPYDKDYKLCPKCYDRVHIKALEHYCASPEDVRLSNDAPSTAESDYAKLREETPHKPTEYVSEAIIDEGFSRPGEWVPLPPNYSIEVVDDEFHLKNTLCTECNHYTQWDFVPQGEQWMCQCGKVQDLTIVETGHFFYPTLAPVQITIYLSGPMTGIPEFNRPEFDKYAEKYRGMGFKVLSPPELDERHLESSYEDCIRRDVRVLLEDGVNRIYLLPGWQKSKGANLEVHLAKMFKIPIYDTQTDALWVEDVAQEARRIVMGDRGNDYGTPLKDFGRTSGMLNSLFNHKLKEKLTEEDIALMMICVKLSRLTNSPNHRDSLADIIGYALTYELVQKERNEIDLVRSNTSVN